MSRPRGRPSKLTKETIKALVEALEEGDTYVVACADAGIDYRSFRRWIVKGEGAQQGEYCHFCQVVRAAEMVGRGKMERRAFKESKPLEYLERRYPEDWGKTDRHEITGAGGGELVINLNQVNRPTPKDADD